MSESICKGLCKYKNIFGEEKKGPHRYRFFGIAIVDLAFTVLGAWLISKYYYKNKYFLKVFIVLIVIGIIVHRIFCVNTTINRLIFGEIKCQLPRT